MTYVYSFLRDVGFFIICRDEMRMLKLILKKEFVRRKEVTEVKVHFSFCESSISYAIVYFFLVCLFVFLSMYICVHISMYV